MRTFRQAAFTFILTPVIAIGCGNPDDPMLDEVIQSEIVGGTVTTSRPEIGMANGCTATLIAPQWVITASHCVGFSTANPTNYSVAFTNPSANGGQPIQFGVQRILNFGPSSPTTIPASNIDLYTGTHPFLETTDFSGSNDIALLQLATPVPRSLVPTPAAIAASLPAVGATVTDFGYGCTDFTATSTSVDGKKRFASWTFTAPGSTGNTIPTTSLINADGVTVAYTGGFAPSYFFHTGGHVCPGDSGGPVVTGALADNGAIWGVNSAGTGGVGNDSFGAVAFLRKPVCRGIYGTEPHAWCVPGAPLTVPPVGCATAQGTTDTSRKTDQVITAVCAQDPICCTPTTFWDAVCIEEAHSLVGQVPGCAPTDDCQRVSDEFGVSPSTFGFAPPEIQTWWTKNACSTSPNTSTSLCQKASELFGISGASPGYAPPSVQSWFSSNHCTTLPLVTESACQRVSDVYGTTAYVTWGSAPSYVQTWWAANSCVTVPHGITACQKAADLYGIVAGVTWGFAPTEAQTWWTASACSASSSTSATQLCQNAANLYALPSSAASVPATATNWWNAQGCNVNPSCQGLSETFGIAANVTWGYAGAPATPVPTYIQTWWTQAGCQTRPLFSGSTCQRASNTFGIQGQVGTQTFAFAPAFVQSWWSASGCNNRPEPLPVHIPLTP